MPRPIVVAIAAPFNPSSGNGPPVDESGAKDNIDAAGYRQASHRNSSVSRTAKYSVD